MRWPPGASWPLVGAAVALGVEELLWMVAVSSWPVLGHLPGYELPWCRASAVLACCLGLLAGALCADGRPRWLSPVAVVGACSLPLLMAVASMAAGWMLLKREVPYYPAGAGPIWLLEGLGRLGTCAARLACAVPGALLVVLVAVRGRGVAWLCVPGSALAALVLVERARIGSAARAARVLLDAGEAGRVVDLPWPGAWWVVVAMLLSAGCAAAVWRYGSRSGALGWGLAWMAALDPARVGLPLLLLAPAGIQHVSALPSARTLSAGGLGTVLDLTGERPLLAGREVSPARFGEALSEGGYAWQGARFRFWLPVWTPAAWADALRERLVVAPSGERAVGADAELVAVAMRHGVLDAFVAGHMVVAPAGALASLFATPVVQLHLDDPRMPDGVRKVGTWVLLRPGEGLVRGAGSCRGRFELPARLDDLAERVASCGDAAALLPEPETSWQSVFSVAEALGGGAGGASERGRLGLMLPGGPYPGLGRFRSALWRAEPVP